MPEPRKTQPGFLACDACKRTIPYTRFTKDEVDLTRTPLHKCVNWEVRAFNRWCDHDPFYEPIPAAQEEAS